MSEKINTHNLRIDFGKHKGERWTRVPADYLRWLINQPIDESKAFMQEWVDIAKAELERRGTKVSRDLDLSPHAVDNASLRLRRTWHETSNKGEGLYTWLFRVATEAIETKVEMKDATDPWEVDTMPEKIEYMGIKFVFKWGNLYPILKTVMPVKNKKHDSQRSS